MTSRLHERDAEALAIAQQRDGAIEQAEIRAQDLAEYINSLEVKIEEKKLENDNLISEVLEPEELNFTLSY